MGSSYPGLSREVLRWIYKQGWRALRPAQEAALKPILECRRDVVIAAGTAAGKTEAAFLPILSLLNREDDEGLAEAGCRVLYVAPLKALINDQYDRLIEMTAGMDIPVVRWHGDANQTRKRRFLGKPDGILQITPESLEAIHVLHGTLLPKLFKSLRYVVVDELHAFIGSERGRQLQSLLHLVEIAISRRIPRIGLSATLGDTALAASYLRPGGDDIVVVESKGEEQDIRLQLRGYVERAPDAMGKGSAGNAPDIASDVFRTLRGRNNLIFANSRNRVEMLADRLREDSDKRRVPNEFWPHHGSLGKEIREDVERELKAGERPASVICTSTLEMGIDIGWVSSIAQVGVPPSVASMRQRLGRSGRRGEPAVLRMYVQEAELTPKSHIRDRLRTRIVQSVAMIQLMIAGWVESPDNRTLNLSTLVHQIMALIAQLGGVTVAKTWSLLCGTGPFANIEQQVFIELLRAMDDADLIEQNQSGVLLLGETGERLVGHYTFYAVFQTPQEYTLIANGRRLGSLPIDRPILPQSFLIFSGRRWLVVDVDDQKKVIQLQPAVTGIAPKFGGNAGRVHDEVRAAMRRVYSNEEIPAFLNAEAMELLREGRQAFNDLDLVDEDIVAEGRETHWFTWRGDRFNDTWTAYFSSRGLRAENSGPFITIEAEEVEAREVITMAYKDPRPSLQALARAVVNKEKEKYDWVLPEPLLCCNYVSTSMNVDAFERQPPGCETEVK